MSFKHPLFLLLVLVAVFVGALSGAANGHAWVIDGYMEQELRTSGSTTALDSRTLLHCNWGWNGMCNGYYEAGIFNVKTKGAVIKDENDRDATFKKAGKNYWIFRYITYDMPKP